MAHAGTMGLGQTTKAARGGNPWLVVAVMVAIVVATLGVWFATGSGLTTSSALTVVVAPVTGLVTVCPTVDDDDGGGGGGPCAQLADSRQENNAQIARTPRTGGIQFGRRTIFIVASPCLQAHVRSRGPAGRTVQPAATSNRSGSLVMKLRDGSRSGREAGNRTPAHL